MSEADCEAAFEVACAGTVDPHTSATQESPEGTYQESQEADSEDTETVQNEQEAVAETVPLATVLETADDCPLESAGMEYPLCVTASQLGTDQISAPSTSAQVEDGFAASLTRPATEPERPTG